MSGLKYSVYPLGDSAVIFDFGNVIDERINRHVMVMAEVFKNASIGGIKDIVPAYASITVHYDPVVCKRSADRLAYDAVKSQLEKLITDVEGTGDLTARTMRIPVCYAKRYGWDLDEMAAKTNLGVDELIRLHTAGRYRVYMVGFLPGFAYMGEVDARIAVPRRSEPRTHIDAGCVGIAGRQTGIYPLTSPGGWQIIGRTPLQLFDKTREHPTLLQAGDSVEFFSITEDEFDNY